MGWNAYIEDDQKTLQYSAVRIASLLDFGVLVHDVQARYYNWIGVYNREDRLYTEADECLKDASASLLLSTCWMVRLSQSVPSIPKERTPSVVLLFTELQNDSVTADAEQNYISKGWKQYINLNYC